MRPNLAVAVGRAWWWRKGLRKDFVKHLYRPKGRRDHEAAARFQPVRSCPLFLSAHPSCSRSSFPTDLSTGDLEAAVATKEGLAVSPFASMACEAARPVRRQSISCGRTVRSVLNSGLGPDSFLGVGGSGGGVAGREDG